MGAPHPGLLPASGEKEIWEPLILAFSPQAGRRKFRCFPLEFGCKPGSVPAFVTSRGWRSFIWAARCRTARATNLESGIGAGHAGGLLRDPYSVLLQVGFAVPLLSPGGRCALTTPFHPCPVARSPARPGGLFSVALSFESPRLAVSQHPAHGSPDFPRRRAGAAATTFRTPAGSSGSIAQRTWACPLRRRTRIRMGPDRPSSGLPSRRCDGSRGRSRWSCRVGGRCRAAAARSCCNPDRCRCEPW